MALPSGQTQQREDKHFFLLSSQKESAVLRTRGEHTHIQVLNLNVKLLHSDLAEDFEECGHRVHAIEEAHRKSKVQHRAPDGEPKESLLQAVVELWPTAECRQNPQLQNNITHTTTHTHTYHMK